MSAYKRHPESRLWREGTIPAGNARKHHGVKRPWFPAVPAARCMVTEPSREPQQEHGSVPSVRSPSAPCFLLVTRICRTWGKTGRSEEAQTAAGSPSGWPHRPRCSGGREPLPVFLASRRSSGPLCRKVTASGPRLMDGGRINSSISRLGRSQASCLCQSALWTWRFCQKHQNKTNNRESR